MFKFSIQQKDKKTKARVGRLVTPHGVIKTPTFVPVGTQATVKSLTPQDLKDIGAQIVLANTYHLMLRPGADIVEHFGGLSKYMGWEGPTMTDSGGYQVFSLGVAHHTSNADKKTLTSGKLNKFSKAEEVAEHSIEEVRMRKTQRIKPATIDEKGVTFYSHLDGKKHRLDPQSSIALQEKIGADLIVAFDDHESPLWTHKDTALSLERTNRWGLESLASQTRKDQLMYGVTHGGLYEDLRIESAKFTEKHFGAIAIGGSYSTKETLYKVIEWTLPHLSEDKPRHLLGIGEIADMLEAVGRGMDCFDCVAATRRARHGSIYIHPVNGGRKENSFTLQITNGLFIKDTQPLDPGCGCYTCTHFSRGYLYHLFRAEEILAHRLATYHNVYFLTKFMEEIREAIKNGRFNELKNEWLTV